MNPQLLVAMSSMVDGSMSAAVTDDERLANRTKFLNAYSVSPDQTTLVRLEYVGEDYTRFYTVSSDQAGDGIVRASSLTADALFTQAKNLTLLLPVADCIAAVYFDPVRQAMGLVHLGRHNLLQNAGSAAATYMMSDFGSLPTDIQVWLSPAAGRENYPLYDFDNRSMHEVALEQLIAAGILPENTQVDIRDTTRDDGLFSHSQFLQGNRSSDGRQAVIAMMRP